MPVDRKQKFARVVTWLILGLGFAMISMAVYNLAWNIQDYWLSLLILIVASSFAYHIKVDFPFARISQAYSVNFLALMVLGPWTGSLVAALGVTLGDGIFLRKRRYAIAVNAAVQFLTTYLTGSVYFLLGGIGAGSESTDFLSHPDVKVFIPLFIAALIHTTTNISLIVPAMMGSGKNIPQATLMKLTQWDLISTLLFAPLSFYIFLIYGKSSGFYLVPPLFFLLICWVLVQRTLELNLAKSQLDLTVDRLRKITQISKAINAAGLNPEEILDIVLVNGMMVCGAQAAAIRLFDSAPSGDVAELSRPDNARWRKFFISESFQQIVNHIRDSGKSLLIDEFRVDNLGPWFHPALIEEHGIKSFLAFPILREDQVEGLLFFAGDQPNMFTQTHIETIDYLSGEIAIAIRNAGIHHKITVQNTRKDEEIKLAERVQRHILPKLYHAGNIRIEGRITPARMLSGDFFDIVDLENDRLGIAMGDVSGKGVPASLTMMAIINSLRVLAHKVKRPSEMLQALNENLFEAEASIEDFLQYSTGFYAILERATLRLQYSIAGCEKPLWWHNKQKILTVLDGEGLPLGMFSNSRYTVKKIELAPGDKIIFYTDGVTDAPNPSGKRYGRQAFMSSIEINSLKKKGNLLDSLLTDLNRFRNGAEPFDDIAIMAVEILDSPSGMVDVDAKSDESTIPIDVSPVVQKSEITLFPR